MSGFGFISGAFSGLHEETTKSGARIVSFDVDFHEPGKDGKMFPQVTNVKVFSQKAIDKLANTPSGSRVECRVNLGGRRDANGKVWNDTTLDFDKVKVTAPPKGQSSTPPGCRPAAPRQASPPQHPVRQYSTQDEPQEGQSVDGIDDSVPF